LVAPSVLSADFTILREEIRKIEDSGGDLVHIDVMDGQFVPNITVGSLIVKAIRKCTELPLDVHLMINEPGRFIKEFAEAGSDIITVHAEAYSSGTRDKGQGIRKGMSASTNKIDDKRVKEVLGKIKSFGKKAGLSLNPDSPFCIKGVVDHADMILIMSVHPGFGGQEFIEGVIPKIKEARRSYGGDIEVDGGINDKNVGAIIAAGANIIVAGSYFFSAKDPEGAVKKLRI